MDATLNARSAIDPTADEAAEALAWVRARRAVDAVEEIRSNDWARTFELTTGSSRVFLKLVPPNRAHRLTHLVEIAHRFPEQVPVVLACEASRGWLLTADHGGRDIDDESDQELEQLLSTLAGMQSAMAHDSALLARLDRFAWERMPHELMQFLERDDEQATEPPFGAARFIGAAAARRHATCCARDCS